jgi:transglutaminase-like putative cysteine protease/Flp pilus assembly protein TadD
LPEASVLQSVSRNRYFYLFALLSACLCSLITVRAQQPSQATSAPSLETWKTAHFSVPAKDLFEAATNVSVPEGTNISILEDDDTFSFDEAGRLTHTGYVVYKILTTKGAEGWDSISVGWEPWHQLRPEIRVRVITPDYAEHALDPKNINETPAHDGEYKIYSDGKRLHAPFPAITQDVVVEEEYSERETEPLFAGGHAGWTTFGRERMPVAHSHLEFDAPASLPLRTSTLLLDNVKPQRVEANGRVKLVWDLGRLEGIESRDQFLPPDVTHFPQVSYSTGVSWQNLATEYSRVVDTRVSEAALQPFVDGLIAGKTSIADKEAALLDYLDREVRYTGIEFGGAAILPHDPAETLAKKYGDCKDKATLLVTMLRAAGIPAYVALLNAGSRMDVPVDLPGVGLFDHAIVYVPGAPAGAGAKGKPADPDLWIDATDQYARLGQLPIADQGRMALIARPESNALSPTPEFSSKENALVEYREIKLSDNGPANVVEKTQPRGVYESRYRSFYADRPDKDTRDNLTNYVKSQYIAEKLSTVDRTDPGDLSKQFELTIACEKVKRGYTGLTDAEAAIRYEALFFRLPDELTRKKDAEKKKDEDKEHPMPPRTVDWELIEPYTVDLNYSIVPPAGFVPKELPKSGTIALGPAVLKEDFSTTDDGVVHVRLGFDTIKRRYTVAEATEMRNKVAELISGPAILVAFEPKGQVLLREGKVREALASYRGVIAQHPNEAVHHLQLADVLLDAGMGEAARAEAREAVKLDPKSPVAQKELAQILKHDLVGRNLRPGSDLAGAAEAYRAAASLDPDDNSTRADLAILLEYDPVGRRYSRQAPLKDAVAEYEKLGQDKLSELELSNNLAFARFYAGDYAGACKAGQAINPEPKALLAACIAAQQGSKAGMAEVNKRASDESAFKETAHTAGEMLMNVRQYPLAADFLQAGASGDNAAQAVGLASLLRDAHHHEDLHFANTPQDLVKQSFLLAMDPDLTEAKLIALSSRNARAVLTAQDSDERKRTLESGRALNSQLAREDSFLDVTLDILAQAFDPKIEGSDDTGYRLKVQVPGGNNLTFFVVKEEGQYKLLDTTQEPNSIALEMLDRIQAGDLKGAKVLLDWLREDSHLEGGDDPLGGPVFPRFWIKGQAPDAAKMKLAAAAILAGSRPTAARGVPILEDALKTATTDRDKTNIRLALGLGYSVLQNFQGLLSVSAVLLEGTPESRLAYLDKVEALIGLQRYDDALAVADERLKLLENDTDALQSRTRIETARGNYAAARGWLQKLAALGKQDAEQLNEDAWLALYTSKIDDKDLATGIKATQLAKDNPHILHTLACLYAEAGKTKEARDLLIRSMDELNLDEPNDDYWYAFGRIAEQYGERAIAIADYRKLEKPKQVLAVSSSSWQLAQSRLKAIDADRLGAASQASATPKIEP